MNISIGQSCIKLLSTYSILAGVLFTADKLGQVFPLGTNMEISKRFPGFMTSAYRQV